MNHRVVNIQAISASDPPATSHDSVSEVSPIDVSVIHLVEDVEQPYVARLRARFPILTHADHPLLRGGAWTFVGQFGAQSIALAANAIVGRVLGPAGFGLYSLAQTMGNTAATVAGYAPALVGTRAAADARTSRAEAHDATRRSLRTAFFVALIATAILVALSPRYAHLVAQSKEALVVFGVASTLTLPLIWLGTCGALLAGLGAFRLFAIGRIISAPFAAALTVVGALTLGVPGALLGLLLGTVVIAAVAHIRVRRAVALIPKGDATIARSRTTNDRLLLPAALSSAASAPVIWICQTLLATRGGLSSVAVIGASIVWGAALLLVPTSLNQALLAELAHAATLPAGAARRVFLLGWNTAIVSVLALLPLIVLAAPVIMRLYGFQGASTILAFRLVVGAYAIQGITGSAIKVLESFGRIWIQLALNLAWAGVFIGLVMVWRSNGAVGFGCAAITSFLIHGTLVHLFAFHVLARATHDGHV
jgi:O-antigen/teichoic acid export membrane protein